MNHQSYWYFSDLHNNNFLSQSCRAVVVFAYEFRCVLITVEAGYDGETGSESENKILSSAIFCPSEQIRYLFSWLYWNWRISHKSFVVTVSSNLSSGVGIRVSRWTGGSAVGSPQILIGSFNGPSSKQANEIKRRILRLDLETQLHRSYWKTNLFPSSPL